ncbi:condensation domain-containing protein [Streptomyces luteireticuli]|uniref:Condensation domain-containing protein n=1 Tax=Streptomyces luteireticuli TaxID=173858 RepID=A0ABP3ISE0_9ACTN
MFQVPIEETEIAPGRVFVWNLVSTRTNRPAGPVPPPREATTYNQVRHFTVARDARDTDDAFSSYVAGTFEIPGQVDLRALESALLHVVRRHEVLRCTFGELAGDVSCGPLDPDAVGLSIAEVGHIESPARIRSYLHEFFRGIDTLSWPLIGMGAVVRDDSTTVFFSCDHLVSDGLSTPIAVHDIATVYAALARGRRPDLPEVGSYLGYSREQRRRYREMDADDGRLDHWKGFMERNGDFFPPFPLDLGLEPGRLYPTVNELDPLLSADGTEALEARCRKAEGRLFMGLLAAVGVSLRKEGGPDVYRGLMPVNERGRGAYAHTMGWFINTLPVEFPVGEGRGLDETMAGVSAGLDEMWRHVDVPFVKAWSLLAPEHFSLRTWPFAVNFFSYLDFRKVPGARHHSAWRARKHIWSSRTNGICFWFHRNDTGLYMNSIYADTAEARRTKAALGRTLVRTMENMAHHGTF